MYESFGFPHQSQYLLFSIFFILCVPAGV
jgi:hypothetical protein